ncbi:MAG: hypothetical protein FJY67_07300 [Calditrichaeota bacterium]|nr:hypothetical protein [Calditrichota bacterium]
MPRLTIKPRPYPEFEGQSDEVETDAPASSKLPAVALTKDLVLSVAAMKRTYNEISAELGVSLIQLHKFCRRRGLQERIRRLLLENVLNPMGLTREDILELAHESDGYIKLANRIAFSYPTGVKLMKRYGILEEVKAITRRNRLGEPLDVVKVRKEWLDKAKVCKSYGDLASTLGIEKSGVETIAKRIGIGERLKEKFAKNRIIRLPEDMVKRAENFATLTQLATSIGLSTSSTVFHLKRAGIYDQVKATLAVRYSVIKVQVRASIRVEDLVVAARESKNFADIARKMNLSRQRVDQLLNKYGIHDKVKAMMRGGPEIDLASIPHLPRRKKRARSQK